MTQYAALLILLAAPWAAQDADPVEKLIADLGDERVAVRESALQGIIATGPRAIPRLRDALRSQDAEVRQRATCALSELERAEKLGGVMQSRPPVTLDLRDASFAQALREIAEQTIELGMVEADLIKSLQRAPEPEPAEEEVLDLIATDENIFGVMDVNEEPLPEGVGLEDLSPDDIEAAIAAELGGGGRR